MLVKLFIKTVPKTVSNIRLNKFNATAMNKKLQLTSAYLYRRAAALSVEIGDAEQQMELNLKADHLESIKTKKKIDQRAVRDKCRTIVENAQKAIAKKNYEQAIKGYEEVTEYFFQLGDEDAATDFFEQTINMRDQLKKNEE